jgi:hypothetical protein
MARLVALVVALAVGIGGALPRWIAYRCAMTGAVESDACCTRQPAAEQTIGDVCCDALESPALAERIGPRTLEPNMAPAPFVGLLSLPSPAVFASASSEVMRVVGAASPLRPAVLHLSSVLRI